MLGKLSLFAIDRLESGGGSGGGERESSVFEKTSLEAIYS